MNLGTNCKYALAVVTVVIATGGLSGCASSGLVNVWMDPQFNSPPMRNMLVIAMQPDVARRRLWEDAFADALRKHGVTATPSYLLFPNALPDTNDVIRAVREDRYDGCLATARLPSTYLTQDVPGYTSDVPTTRYDPWSNRYYNFWAEVYTPGYTETATVMRHKIEVWSTTGEGALVWTATSEAIDPVSSDAEKRRNRMTSKIVDDLKRKNVIAAQN